MILWTEHMRVLVCGGRNFANRELERHDIAKGKRWFIIRRLEEIAQEHAVATGVDITENWLPNWTVIHGDAPGVDQIAHDFAIVNWTRLEIYPADWDKHGKAAGPLRNVQMLKEGRPDLVVAFPGGRGTAHMVKIAKEAGVPVREFQYGEGSN